MMGSEKGMNISICSRVKTRHILSLFTLLTLFVMYVLIASSSQLSFVDNVTMKMKSDLFSVLNKLVNYNGSVSINGSNHFVLKDLATRRWLQQDTRTRTAVSHGPVPSYATTRNVTLAQEKQDKTRDYRQQINIDGTNKNNPNDGRKDICTQCFKHDFNYIIDNENICKATHKEQVIKLLILIMTEHNNIQQRNAIRNTWLTYAKNNTGEVRYAFLLGEVKETALQAAVLEENKIFHDLIKEDFTDTYTNLTFKTIMSFKWAATKCAHAQYVMKTDDDMYVNVLNLLQSVSKFATDLQSGIGGACHKQAAPNRDTRSKWFASIKSYPGRMYPGFCSGTGYVTSMNVARKVYEISPSIPFFHLEDVYVSLCINKLRFKLIPIPGFNTIKPRLDPCMYKNNGFITAHHLSAKELRYIWKAKCHR